MYTVKAKVKKVLKIIIKFALENVIYANLTSNNYNRVTGKMLITIFGSCRQDSIAKHFKVSRIRDGLTYPHYTKEIIQAIKFVKSKGTISPSNLKVFRNIQMGNKIDPIKLLWKQFNATDLFVVEITSRTAYEHKGDYYHHVIIENTDRLKDKNHDISISKRIQSDIEICQDMEEIRNLLAPKPVIFVTHFCTYDSGERANLRNLVVSQGKKMAVKVIDPSELLLNYPVSKLTIDEEVISHFSDFAHRVLAGRYQLEILEQILLNRKEENFPYLDQVIDSTLPRKQFVGFHGLGDHGFGSVFLYRYAISHGRIPRVNKQNFEARKYLIDNNECRAIDYKKVKYIFHNKISNNEFKNTMNVYTNKRPKGEFDDQMRDFFLVNFLTPNELLRKELIKIKLELNLEGDYSVIHIRFGDNINRFNGKSNLEIEKKLTNFLEVLTTCYYPPNEFLILTDSQFFNNLSRNKGFKARRGGVSNRGLSGTEDNHGYLTIIDFILMLGGKSINQVSYASRGSGFSELASLISGNKLYYNSDLSKKLREHLILT